MKNQKKFALNLDEKGQTMVEYVLIIAVTITLTVGIFDKLRSYLLTDPNSLTNRYLSSFSASFGSGSNFQGNYKRFRLTR